MASSKSTLSIGDYNGKPMIVIGTDNDRYPFQFGPGKATKMLQVMATPNGVRTVVEKLLEIAESNLTEDESQIILGQLPAVKTAKKGK